AAKLTARASREQGPAPGVSDLIFSGSLTDDAGQPLPLQTVTIRVAREADAHDARVAEGLRAAHGCDRTADPSVEGGRQPEGHKEMPRRGPTSWSVRVAGATDAPEIIVVTDEEGRFCFRARLDPDRYRATLVFAPSASASPAFIDGVERDLTFDLTKR